MNLKDCNVERGEAAPHRRDYNLASTERESKPVDTQMDKSTILSTQFEIEHIIPNKIFQQTLIIPDTDQIT